MLQGTRRLVLLAAIVTASQVVAQPLPTALPNRAAAPSRAAREMGSQAGAMTKRLAAHVTRVQRLRQRTDPKDMLKLSCINDGLVTLLLQARVSETAFAAFQVAAAKADDEATLARFTALTRASDAADAATLEIRACIGAREVEVHHAAFASNPTDDCNSLGQSGCSSARSLEYIALASPYTPR